MTDLAANTARRREDDLVKRLMWWGRPKCRIQNGHTLLKRDCREAAALIASLESEKLKLIEDLMKQRNPQGQSS